MFPAALHRVGGNRRFFLRVNPIFANAREIVRALIGPSHNSAISAWVLSRWLLGKGPKPSPVRNFLTMRLGGPHLGLEITGRRFLLKPEVNGIPTNIEHLAGVLFLEAIEFN